MNKEKVFVLLALALALVTGSVATASTPTYTESWDGRGTDSEHCEYAGQPGRPATGWIHWVFATKGDSTGAALTLGGTGSGVYMPGEPLGAEVWHFYTPFFPLTGLTARIDLFGGEEGDGGGLVISDYCPGGVEDLTVVKTAVTSFTRTHEWDIAKRVETEDDWMHSGFPKVWLWADGRGDETATWTIDVTYEGFTDSAWQVSGVITATNTGTLEAVVTGVADVLGGASIAVDCGVTFPYTLAVGSSLVCTYSEDGYVEGMNVATVSTERDSYSGNAAITWGDPTVEVNKTVQVRDISDLFGTVALGSVTAPNDAEFTYRKDFAWADYGAAKCGDWTYDNEALIVETGQSASATLKVNVQCLVYETAFAKAPAGVCFIPTFSRWGWTNRIWPGDYTWPLWAGAGQCDTSKGTLVGSVTVKYSSTTGVVTVEFNVAPPYSLQSTAVYAGYNQFPQMRVGRGWVSTVAPGQYRNQGPFDGTRVWVIAHAVVGMPDPSFGP